MPSYFTLRMQFGRHQDPTVVTEQLLEMVKTTPVDEIMFFYFAEEYNNGHETLEQIQDWIEKSRPYRKALKEVGVETSLNPWHSVLHCGRNRALKPGQDWNLMVGSKGQVESPVVCFLDKKWQAYFLETLRMYAAEGFRVVWIDDDIRYHNHGDLHWGGCFCDAHVAEFNQRAGTSATRAEIEAACLQPGKPHAWRQIWLDMWQDTVLEFMAECQAVLAEGDTKMGLMSSLPSSHAAEGRRWEDWWKVFGGGDPTKAVHRPHYWGYKNTLGTSVINSIMYLDQNRTIQPDGMESGPEIENFTYGQWYKSYRQIATQMCIGHIMGSTNLNISLFDFMGNDVDDIPERTQFLSLMRPNMDWLADTFPMTMKTVGVGIPWTQDMGRKIETKTGKSWYELECGSCISWANWLGAAGIAYSARTQAKVNALTGSILDSFSNETIKEWLSAGVLLDGEAAQVICERGMGNLIGAKSSKMITQKDVLYSIESAVSAKFSFRVGAKNTVNDHAHTKKMFQADLMEGVEVLSELLSPLVETVGHGPYVFENELGGRVAVMPWIASIGGPYLPTMDIYRAHQFKTVVAWLDKGQNVGGVDGVPWLVPQFLTDGESWAGAVWNAGPDETSSIKINRPAGMPAITEAWQLTPKGERIAAKVEGDMISFEKPLYQWDGVIIRA